MNRNLTPQLLLLILFGMLCSTQCIYSQDNVDSLKAILNKVSGQEQVDALNKIAKSMEYRDPDTSLHFASRAADLSQDLEYTTGQAFAYLVMGNANTALSDYQRAEFYYRQSIKLYENVPDKEGLFKAFNNLGNMFRLKGNYDQALTNFLESLKISEEIDSKKGIAYASLNIGLIYSTRLVESESNGLPYFMKTLEICKEIGDHRGAAYAINNIAVIYVGLEEYDSALTYLNESVAIKEQIDDLNGIASSYGNISDIYMLEEDYEKALDYSMRSLDLYRQLNDEYGEVNSLWDVGKSYFMDGNFNQAKVYLMRALNLSEKINSLGIKSGTYQYLYQFYLVQEKYKEALDYYKQYSDIQDSIYNKESETIMAEMRVQYETEKKEAAIEKLENLTTIQELQLRKSQNTKWFFISSSILIFLLGAITYYGYRQKQKANQLLIERNKFEIENKKRAISIFGQQVSKEVALELLSDSFKAGSKKLFACIMFLDIRDFTPYAEDKDPAEIIQYQNDVFGFMIDIISKHHGIINQFLGDGFMATFGAPVSSGNDCQNAVFAAVDIVNKLNQRIEEGKIPDTKVGIGLHAGHIVTGNVGTEYRKQYSITGNTVILASRIEQLNKKYNSSILVSKEVYDQLDDKTLINEHLGEVDLRGRHHPIELIRLV